MRGAAPSRRLPLVRLWPTFALVLILVAPFPWGVLAEAAPAPAQQTAPTVSTAEPMVDRLRWNQTFAPPPQAKADTLGIATAAVQWAVSHDVARFTAPSHSVHVRNGIAEATPTRVTIAFDAEVVPLAWQGFMTVRTTAPAATYTWSGAVLHVSAPAVAAPVAVSIAGGSWSSAQVASSGAPAAPLVPTSAAAPAQSAAPAPSSPPPASPFSGGVVELISRVPPDLWARPHRFLRMFLRGGALFALLLANRGAALDQETRRRIYNYLREHPGALAGEIADSLGVRRQTVLYHLRVLIWENQVVSHANGRRHYFLRDDPKRVDNRHLLSPVTRNLFEMLPETPVTAQELSERLGVTRRTVNWHLGRLRSYGLVHGLRARNGTRYVRAVARGA